MRRVIPLLGTLALAGVLATGCGGGGEPADPTPDTGVTQQSQDAAIGSVGGPQQGDGVEVSIDAIRTTGQSGMVDMDPSTEEVDTEPLEPGQEFLVLDVTVKNVGSAAHEYNGLSWSAADPSSDATYQAGILAVTGSDLSAGDLEPGEEAGGEVAIPIPEDAKQLRVSYDTQLFDRGTQLSWDVTVP